MPWEPWSERLADGRGSPVWFSGVRGGGLGVDQAPWVLCPWMINPVDHRCWFVFFFFSAIHLYSSASDFTHLATPAEWMFEYSYHNKNYKWENYLNQCFLLYPYVDLSFTSLL